MGRFGEILSQRRKEKKVNLRKLAEAVGISPSYLSDLENGKRLPPSGDNEKYKDLLNEIIDYLELTNDQKEELLIAADEELINKGYVTNEMSAYLNNNQAAVVALRKATTKNVEEEKWKKIIRILEGSEE